MKYSHIFFFVLLFFSCEYKKSAEIESDKMEEITLSENTFPYKISEVKQHAENEFSTVFTCSIWPIHVNKTVIEPEIVELCVKSEQYIQLLKAFEKNKKENSFLYMNIQYLEKQKQITDTCVLDGFVNKFGERYHILELRKW